MAAGGTDYGNIIKKSWEGLIKGENLVPLLVGALVLGLASMFTFGILVGPLALGYVMTCNKIARGESVAMDDLWKGFDKLVPSIITMLILGIGVMIGMILCVIPGMVVAFLGTFTFHVMADEGITGMDAIKKSAAIVKANLTDVLVVAIIGGIINSILSMTGIGAIPAMALVMLMMSFLYVEIQGRSGGGAPNTAL